MYCFSGVMLGWIRSGEFFKAIGKGLIWELWSGEELESGKCYFRVVSEDLVFIMAQFLFLCI